MLNNLKYDNKIDMWALGIIIYICMTGQHPFISPKWNTEDSIIK